MATEPPAVAPEASIVPLLAMPLEAVNVTLPPLPLLELALTMPDWLIIPPPPEGRGEFAARVTEPPTAAPDASIVPDWLMVDAAASCTVPPVVLPEASSVPLLSISLAPVNRITPPLLVIELASTVPELLITAPCSALAAAAVISTCPSGAWISWLFWIRVFTVAGSTWMLTRLPPLNWSVTPSPAAIATVPWLAVIVPLLTTVAATKAT